MSKAEAREAMIKKRFGGNNNGASGGSGNARRKKKSAAKVSGADDKKVSTHLKKLNPQVIPGIEEVNIFTDNGEVIHFVQPKIQAAVAHKTFIISGNCDTVSVDSLLPGIIPQMGTDAAKRLAELTAGGAEGMGAVAEEDEEDDDDDEPPELIDDDNEVD